MNLDYMPELGWTYGLPLALLGMVAAGVVLYLVFKQCRCLSERPTSFSESALQADGPVSLLHPTG